MITDKYSNYTDLFDEASDVLNFSMLEDYNEEQIGRSFITRKMTVSNDIEAEKLNKKKGKFISVESKSFDFEDERNKRRLIDLLSGDLGELIGKMNRGKVLAIGLGNNRLTADTLGSATVDKIKISYTDNGIICYKPLTSGLTGIDSYSVIRALANEIKPSLIIAVDTLAARNMSRIGNTYQMTDSGISPGSGVGNAQPWLDKQSLGIPVIAIGVPLVVYARTIIKNIIEQLNAGDTALGRINDELFSNQAIHLVTPTNIEKIIDYNSSVIASAVNQAVYG